MCVCVYVCVCKGVPSPLKVCTWLQGYFGLGGGDFGKFSSNRVTSPHLPLPRRTLSYGEGRRKYAFVRSMGGKQMLRLMRAGIVVCKVVVGMVFLEASFLASY